MSISATIDIQVLSSISSLHLIHMFLNFGWTFDYESTVFYLPLGDDDFDWRRDEISHEKLLRVIAEKWKKNELIGVAMTWKDTGVGGEFLFYSDGAISINLSINRKKLEFGISDVNWYLEKIISPLFTEQIKVESIKFLEHA